MAVTIEECIIILKIALFFTNTDTLIDIIPRAIDKLKDKSKRRH